jgi:PilZ domain
MTDNKRDSLRTPMVTRIRISHPQVGEVVTKTRDISDSGVFVVMDDQDIPDIGSKVEGQVLGLPMGDGPVVAMEVVRIEPGGVGLKFL